MFAGNPGIPDKDLVRGTHQGQRSLRDRIEGWTHDRKRLHSALQNACRGVPIAHGPTTQTESFLFVVHEGSPAHVLLARWHSRPDTAKARASNAGTGRVWMNSRPLQDRVLIRRIEAEAKTAAGIIIPDTAQEKPMEGEVVAVGPGARGEDGTLHPLDVKPGDRVLFGKWSGTEIKLDGEDLIIMKESDIMGVIEGRTATKKKAA